MKNGVKGFLEIQVSRFPPSSSTLVHVTLLARVHVGIWIIDYCPLSDSLWHPLQSFPSINRG